MDKLQNINGINIESYSPLMKNINTCRKLIKNWNKKLINYWNVQEEGIKTKDKLIVQTSIIRFSIHNF